MPRETTERPLLRVTVDGFGLHAAVQDEPHDRKRLVAAPPPRLDGQPLRW
jgi:hypothetical protein